MELTGNTADRWEQISNKLNELAVNMSAKQELVKAITASLEELNTEFNDIRQTLEQLGNVTYKEVLREESNTLNDADPIIFQPEQQKTENNIAEVPQVDEQSPTTNKEKVLGKQKKSKKASTTKDSEDNKDQDPKQATLMEV